MKIDERRPPDPMPGANYTVTIIPVDQIKGADITYIVKIASTRMNSTISNKPFIAPRRERSIVKEFYNPVSKDGKLEFSIQTLRRTPGYVQVIAQIQVVDKIDFLSYDLYEIKPEVPPEGGKSGSSNGPFIVVSIIIGVLLIIIVIVLVVVVITYQRKNKDLLEKVQSVSFQAERENNNNDGDNLLIN